MKKVRKKEGFKAVLQFACLGRRKKWSAILELEKSKPVRLRYKVLVVIKSDRT